MLDEYRYLDPSSKTTQDLIEYLAKKEESELLEVVLDMLKHMAEQQGELTARRKYNTPREEMLRAVQEEKDK